MGSKKISAVGIHFWNEVWRRNGLDKNADFHKDSIYEKLMTLNLKSYKFVKLKLRMISLSKNVLATASLAHEKNVLKVLDNMEINHS